MSTIRNDGAGPYDTTTQPCPIPEKKVIGTTTTTARRDAAGASAGDSTALASSIAVVS